MTGTGGLCIERAVYVSGGKGKRQTMLTYVVINIPRKLEGGWRVLMSFEGSSYASHGGNSWFDLHIYTSPSTLLSPWSVIFNSCLHVQMMMMVFPSARHHLSNFATFFPTKVRKPLKIRCGEDAS